MVHLGYDRWENFQAAVRRAKDSAANSLGFLPAQDQFREVTKMVSTGSGAERAVADFALTRFASYLLAMNGDPRKSEVADAQRYFAEQTRRAEMAQAQALAQWSIPSNLADALLLAGRLEAERAALAAENVRKDERLAIAEPKARFVDELMDGEDEFSVRDAAQMLAHNGVKIGQGRLFDFLREQGWIGRDGRAYQPHIEAQRLSSRPARWTNKVTGQTGIRPTVKVTARGLVELHRLLGGTGRMAMPKQLPFGEEWAS